MTNITVESDLDKLFRKKAILERLIKELLEVDGVSIVVEVDPNKL